MNAEFHWHYISVWSIDILFCAVVTMAGSQVDRSMYMYISLGRPETFEKVAKMGVGIDILPWEVTLLTHFKSFAHK